MSEQQRDLNALSQVFKNYKAEWLASAVFDFFQEPIYQHELTSNQPCVLYGGRGSGKTTALLGLSYEGFPETPANRRMSSPSELPYYGIFHRVNGISAAEFEGDELNSREWERLFAHYWNLVMIESLTRFARWFIDNEREAINISDKAIYSVASLLLPDSTGILTLETLADGVRAELGALAKKVSSIGDETIGKVSTLGEPVNLFISHLRENKCIGSKGVFYIVDEYENLLTYQQKLVNTLIKYSAPLYTFKVGVRRYGFRTYATLSPIDYLEHPADFVQLTIEEKFTKIEFQKFAKSVCQSRLEQVRGFGGIDLDNLLEKVSLNEEALRLSTESGTVQNAYKIVRETCAKLNCELDIDELDSYILVSYSKHHNVELFSLIRRVEKHWKRWRIHLDNYRYHSLFAIKKGKSGIRKMFAGLPTYSLMADNNIRAFMELIEQAIIHWVNEDPKSDIISAEIQTKAAIYVGERRLKILEGRSLVGNSVCRFVISLGRLFGLMAARTYGGAPETDQFDLPEEYESKSLRGDDAALTIGVLLKEAVMNLALVERTATKPRSPADTKGRDFQIHPIFAAYFAISHRKKRKIRLSERNFLGLVEQPSETIPRMLKTISSDEVEESDLQLDFS